MLVDVNLIPRNQNDTMIAFLAGMDAGENRSDHPQTGVYVSHLNFNHEVRSKLRDAPMYKNIESEIKWCKGILKRCEEKGQNPDFWKEKVAELETVPKNIEKYYNKNNWKKPKEDELDDETPTELHSYGVCDSVEQLLSLYDFKADPRKLVILMTEIRREHQSPDGGWRWHKWGSYVGLHTPEYEYLYDEKNIESVFVFHIYEVLDA